MGELSQAIHKKYTSWRADRAAMLEIHEQGMAARRLERSALIYTTPQDFGINSDDQVVMTTDVATIEDPERREVLQALTGKSPDFREQVAQLVVANALQPDDEIAPAVKVTSDDLRHLLSTEQPVHADPPPPAAVVFATDVEPQDTHIPEVKKPGLHLGYEPIARGATTQRNTGLHLDDGERETMRFTLLRKRP